jgi:hypothetical protein
MRRSTTLAALVLQLGSQYGTAASVAGPPPAAGAHAPVPGAAPRRRRRRRSALDPYRSIAETFVRRRDRAPDPSAYTYVRLARLIERRSGRRFSISSIQRRMCHWGLAVGMRRYKR